MDKLFNDLRMQRAESILINSNSLPYARGWAVVYLSAWSLHLEKFANKRPHSKSAEFCLNEASRIKNLIKTYFR